MAQPRAEIPDARPLRSGEQGRIPLAGGGLSFLWPRLRAGRWPLAGQLLAVRSFRPSEQTEEPGLMPLTSHSPLPGHKGRPVQRFVRRWALAGITLG